MVDYKFINSVFMSVKESDKSIKLSDTNKDELGVYNFNSYMLR